MNLKKIILCVLIAVSSTNLFATSGRETRNLGLMMAGVIITYHGVHLLTRKSHGTTEKVFDVLGGFALITAGILGIALSEEINREIERAFR